MQKLFSTFVGLALFYCHANSQNRSNLWLLGGNYSFTDYYTQIDFSNGFADTSRDYRTMTMYNTNASICDTNGNLLFYTNGQWIANFKGDTIKNSEHFNPGYLTDTFYQHGLGATQAALILPHPQANCLYDLFHVSEQFSDGSEPRALYLGRSTVDMCLNNGEGEMMLKNQHLIDDSLIWGRLTATKHGNGRDWWVVSHEWNTQRYYLFLLTPDSTYGPFTQTIGQIHKVDNFGMASFSPDGNYYAMISPVYDHKLDILKFDRCTGFFTDVIVSEVLPDTSTYWWMSVAFSPDSRFLYAIQIKEIWQYDLWASDVQASKVLVAVYEPFLAPFYTDFFLAQLAPDNKIYISTVNFDSLIHVIDQPNESGAACNVLQNQNGVWLPTDNVSLPNLPNYDLGVLPGSPCDTLTTTSGITFQIFNFTVQPNPVSDWLNIIYHTEQDAVFELVDLHGHRVAQVQLYHYFKNRLLNVKKLPAGLYAYSIKIKGEKMKEGKVAVSR
jgi:hypothetical protein